MKKIIFLILMLIVVTGCGFGNRNGNKVTDAEKFKQEYSQVSDNNPFVYATPSDVINLIENGTGVLFMGAKQDAWSQAVAPILDTAAKENGITKIYYYDFREIQTQNTAEYQKMLLLLDAFLKEDEEGKKNLTYPTIYGIKNGAIVGRHDILHDGTAETIELNEEQSNAIKEAYNTIINNTKTTE